MAGFFDVWLMRSWNMSESRLTSKKCVWTAPACTDCIYRFLHVYILYCFVCVLLYLFRNSFTVSKCSPKCVQKSSKNTRKWTHFRIFSFLFAPREASQKRDKNWVPKFEKITPKGRPKGPTNQTLFSIKWPQSAQGPRDPPPGGPWTSQIMFFYDFGPQNDPRNYWNLGSVRKQLITAKHQKKMASAPPCMFTFLEAFLQAE